MKQRPKPNNQDTNVIAFLKAPSPKDLQHEAAALIKVMTGAVAELESAGKDTATLRGALERLIEARSAIAFWTEQYALKNFHNTRAGVMPPPANDNDSRPNKTVDDLEESLKDALLAARQELRSSGYQGKDDNVVPFPTAEKRPSATNSVPVAEDGIFSAP